MSATLVLLLLPVAYARISVVVRASTNDAQLEYYGADVDVISDKEALSFGMSDHALKNAAEQFSGGRPADIFYKSPTPWNDLYKSYGWSEVRRHLYARSARVIGIKTQPVVLTTHEFINNSTIKAKYNAGITQEVQDTVSSSWNKGGELTVGHEINYNINFAFGSAGGSTSISYSSSWGQGQTKSKTVTVGSNSGVEVELEPGQAVYASLTATRGTLDIQVDYTAILDGHLACNYPRRFRGHHFWAYDVNAVARAGSLRRSIDSTEVIKIGFYSDAQIRVYDKATSSDLLAVDVAMN